MATIPRSQNHLAEMLGISKAAASRNAAKGMPINTLEDAQAWRKAHQNIAKRKASPKPPEQPTDPFDADMGESHDDARTRREIAEANLAEMREGEERKDLIRVSAVKTVLASVLTTVRDTLLQIPPRVSPMLAADSDAASVCATLEKEIHHALVNLSRAGTAL